MPLAAARPKQETHATLERMQPIHDRLLFSAAIFWSALLLLLIQPVMAKAILPWFGGAAGVWTASMLFFQVVLLIGYLYAHLTTRLLAVRSQVVLHITLIAASVILLPISPSPEWKPSNGGDPLPRILQLLSVTVGLPYFLLSTTSPLLQSWYTRTVRIEFPYRLYAISNLGSLIALIAYPFAVEPNLTTGSQMGAWSVGYAVFALLCMTAALRSLNAAPFTPERYNASGQQHLLWFALAACPSILWMAVANHLTQDVAAAPFMWVLPLGLYLFSFIVCFDRDGWYRPSLFRWLLPLAWLGIAMGIGQQNVLSIRWLVAMFAVSLFLCCMFCHGELARLRPPSRELTAYYLTMAAGGAAGGLFIALAAPRIFNRFLELQLGLIMCMLLALPAIYGMGGRRVLHFSGTALLAVIVALNMGSPGYTKEVNTRNFYGALRVLETGAADVAYRALYNGAIKHGVQYLAPDRSRLPTTYYGPSSGAALAINAGHPGPRRVGVIGLGVGTMAAYGRTGDFYKFYEINPAVIHVANVEFRYLRESQAKIDVVTGDGRLSLEREQPQNLDVLIVDAFSGDSIPMHLLTREAFQLYFQHLKQDGALAIHVTNMHLDLTPVVKRLADAMGKLSLLIESDKEDEVMLYSSWIVVTSNKDLALKLYPQSSRLPGRPDFPIWTDDYSNLLRIMK